MKTVSQRTFSQPTLPKKYNIVGPKDIASIQNDVLLF